ncbi:uncharacterized protein [Watersipora subatra]|uniref:uncharacterized protein n=1 Tax=Watersipora subatra TaxID=2589382 RepID=UPI00355B3829
MNFLQFCYINCWIVLCLSGYRKSRDASQRKATQSAYFVIPAIVLVIGAGCGMRYKYRKSIPWREAHHLKRQATSLKATIDNSKNIDSNNADNRYADNGNADSSDQETSTPRQQAGQRKFTRICIIAQPHEWES